MHRRISRGLGQLTDQVFHLRSESNSLAMLLGRDWHQAAQWELVVVGGEKAVSLPALDAAQQLQRLLLRLQHPCLHYALVSGHMKTNGLI